MIWVLLHPRKLTTTALKPKPPSDFGVTAGAKIALTYDSWEPGVCVSKRALTISMMREPPVSPCVTTTMGASSGTSSS